MIYCPSYKSVIINCRSLNSLVNNLNYLNFLNMCVVNPVTIISNVLIYVCFLYLCLFFCLHIVFVLSFDLQKASCHCRACCTNAFMSFCIVAAIRESLTGGTGKFVFPRTRFYCLFGIVFPNILITFPIFLPSCMEMCKYVILGSLTFSCPIVCCKFHIKPLIIITLCNLWFIIVFPIIHYAFQVCTLSKYLVN